MRKYFFVLYVLGFVIFGVTGIYGQQKEIPLNEDLALHSDKLKVKMGAQWMGKIIKFKFGEYAVTDSKNGMTVTSRNSKLFSTKATSELDHKFSFVLADKSEITALVNVVFSVRTEELESMEILDIVQVGQDVLLEKAENFTAFISTSDQEEDTWVLVMNKSQGSEVIDKNEGFLTNGDRWISIVPVSSDNNGTESVPFPALGYEFFEKEKALCAMQYRGEGVFNMAKNMVWIRTELDKRTQLILAAAMTSLMQKEANHI